MQKRKEPSKRKNELPKHCNPADYESKWIAYWEDEGIFSNHPTDAAEKFCIVIPPPNVTGSLHVGHALNNTLQDALIRYNHMRGRDALWIPGMDHAGIATQNVVEKQLREEGTDRNEVGREKFVERVWKWKELSHDNIKSQLIKLGTALDWTRERFTLDDQCSLAVRTAFKQLFDEGLIYQGKRMINWCPRCTTALSDIEVEYKDIDGAFYHVKYPLEGSDEYIEIATTRPETLLGDSALAVHPDDERYKKFHGKNCILPLVNRVIPIITDEYVDVEFGTGALKITPAHDPNDARIGKKHNLPDFLMLDEEARITEDYPEYAGMDRFDARKKIVEDLKEAGLFIAQEPHLHSVGHCQRCASAVEPYVSLQWFVKMESLAKPAIDAVRDGRMQFVPERWTNVYMDWLENIRDWCISRQLWWGHRIPIWDCPDCGARICEIETPEKCTKCGSEKIVQHDDVLDTWFSSGLWPLSTLGWPNETVDLKNFYPTSVLVTGFDIIFFWVARMMFFGLKFGGDVPFRRVFIHGIVRDANGMKMSKSFGNVMDPLEIIEKYGADALRFTFLYMGSIGQDVSISEDKFRSGRNFCNKLWNAARFIRMAPGDSPSDVLVKDLDPENLDKQDHWILSRMHSLTAENIKLVEAFDLNEALQKIYAFVWHDFCDWYIELSKPSLYGDDEEKSATVKVILNRVMEWSLALLQPFVPFITEEIWESLPLTAGSILENGYPDFEWSEDEDIVERVALAQDITRAIRDIFAKLGIHPSQKMPVTFRGNEKKVAALLDLKYFIDTMSGARVAESIEEGVDVTRVQIDDIEIVVPYGKDKLDDEIRRQRTILEEKGGGELDAEITRMKKKVKGFLNDVKRSEGKLSNENFLSRAPAEVIEKEKAKTADLREELKKVQHRLEIFCAE